MKEQQELETQKIGNRTWHENFVKYTEMIVNHHNYEGLFYERKTDGQIKWVVAGKSKNGEKRQTWWDDKCTELGIPIQRGCYAKVAARIHPTKKHVCQICGREMSVYYEYPSASFLKKLNKLLGVELGHFDLTIREIIARFCNTEDDLKNLNKLFECNCIDKDELIILVYDTLVMEYDRRFSPGVMSNPPDRFDGFHSDGACCRELSDKGRHKINMKTYAQDRRAYEHWADGDFNAANRLMGEFQKSGEDICPQCGKHATMSADHIGSISLGFCHRPKFNALCSSCNSAKNNRFTFDDVQQLLSDERNGEVVVSWHSKDIWDLLKNGITNDLDAGLASSVMLTCHQNVLKVFSMIYYQTGKEFLKQYLHPEFALYDVRFENFNLFDLSKLKILQVPLESKNKESNKNRYLRVSFDALRDFDEKHNRKTKFHTDSISNKINKVVSLIKEGRNQEADISLRETISLLSRNIYNDKWSHK